MRIPPSITAAFDQLNRLHPNRSKASDGIVGDVAHQQRVSDHNPDDKPGTVDDRDADHVREPHAFDVTHDPLHGVDCNMLAECVRQRCAEGKERRVSYIIWNRRITNAASGWSWVLYHGANPHAEHIHVSIHYDDASENDTSPWWPQPNTDVVRLFIDTETGEQRQMIDHIEPLDPNGNAEWFTGLPFAKLRNVLVCHPSRPHVAVPNGLEGYRPGLAAQPVEDNGKLVVVVTGKPGMTAARLLLETLP